MSTIRIYLFLLVGVLAWVGCGQDQTDTSSRSAPPTDTTPSARNAPTAPADTAGQPLRVLVLGNSIAAGSGVAPQQAFPALLQEKIDSLGWTATVQNAGVSGETTAGGLGRIGWLLQNPVDVLVLELGGNDGLRGIDPAVTRKNLTGIIDTTLSTYPQARVLLTGMQIPPNLGSEYTQQFRQVYPTVAAHYERVTLVPFVLEDVAGIDSLMQADGIHPNAHGHRRVARTVWDKLKPILDEMRSNESA